MEKWDRAEGELYDPGGRPRLFPLLLLLPFLPPFFHTFSLILLSVRMQTFWAMCPSSIYCHYHLQPFWPSGSDTFLPFCCSGFVTSRLWNRDTIARSLQGDQPR